MLTRSELAEMKDLVGRVSRGVASREDWSNLAALTLVWQGDAIVAAMAEGGYEMFVRVCRPQHDCHAFGDDDYQRMYTRVCAAAARYQRDLVVH